MSRTLVAAAAILASTVSTTHAGAARSRASGAVSTPASVLGVDLQAMEYARQYANGLFEYGFAPPAAMTPVPSVPFPPASLVAQLFLEENRDSLAIPDEGAIDYVSSEHQCDGSDLVTFSQSYLGYRVETSSFKLVVRNQVVEEIEARFIPLLSSLPVCQPNLQPTEQVKEIVFLPQGDTTSIVVVTIEQLLPEGYREKLRNACTDKVLGWTIVYR